MLDNLNPHGSAANLIKPFKSVCVNLNYLF